MKTLRSSRSAILLPAVCFVAGCGAQSIVATNPQVNGAFINARVTSLPHHKTFTYTGNMQSFIVPAHVTSLNVDVRGAAGGGTTVDGIQYFGRGGRIFAIIPVHPREELYVYVGGKGSTSGGGFNGGGNPATGGASYGGGGASDLRTGLSDNDRIIVGAGGGGEGMFPEVTGGRGGGTRGGDGGADCDSTGYCGDNAGGGFGGTQTAGGAGGPGGAPGTFGIKSGQAGGAGMLAAGGTGGEGGCYSSTSCGCGYFGACPGAGGGGGYYGGGGGGGGGEGYYAGAGGGGGGGSSWAYRRAVDVKTWSGWKKATDNGLVVLNWR